MTFVTNRRERFAGALLLLGFGWSISEGMLIAGYPLAVLLGTALLCGVAVVGKRHLRQLLDMEPSPTDLGLVEVAVGALLLLSLALTMIAQTTFNGLVVWPIVAMLMLAGLHTVWTRLARKHLAEAYAHYGGKRP